MITPGGRFIYPLPVVKLPIAALVSVRDRIAPSRGRGERLVQSVGRIDGNIDVIVHLGLANLMRTSGVKYQDLVDSMLRSSLFCLPGRSSRPCPRCLGSASSQGTGPR